MNFTPTHPNTKLISKYEWKPSSTEGLITELSQIANTGRDTNKFLLYRGHRDHRWLLDSTFVRSFKTTLFGIEPFHRLTQRITESAEFHPAVLNLFLLKFGVLARPSDELEANAEEHDLDAWFEFMKRIQQYPAEDGFFLKGTNLVDWSQSADVALFFANENRAGEGAIFVCDATATGKTLQKIPVGAVLDKMNEIGNSGKPLGVPLLFHPGKQIANQRPKNQQAVYFAQMDLRYDFQQIWELYEREQKTEPVYVKIVLPTDSIHEINSHLKEKDIDSQFIYPDRKYGSAR